MRYFILSFIYVFKFLNHNIFITFYKVSITFRSDNESNAKEGKDNWARHYHVMQGLTNEQLREKLTRWVEELKDMETHDNKKCQAIIKAIGSVYVKYYIPAIRQVIYDALLACEFPGMLYTNLFIKKNTQ